MSSTNLLPVILTRLVYMVPTLVIVIGGIVYVMRTKGLEGVLCIIGQCLVVIGHILSTTLQMSSIRGSLDHTLVVRYSQFVQIPYMLGAVVFAVGFLMIALKQRPSVTPTKMPSVIR